MLLPLAALALREHDVPLLALDLGLRPLQLPVEVAADVPRILDVGDAAVLAHPRDGVALVCGQQVVGAHGHVGGGVAALLVLDLVGDVVEQHRHAIGYDVDCCVVL